MGLRVQRNLAKTSLDLCGRIHNRTELERLAKDYGYQARCNAGPCLRAKTCVQGRFELAERGTLASWPSRPDPRMPITPLVATLRPNARTCSGFHADQCTTTVFGLA